MPRELIGLLIVMGMIGLYVLTYLLNKNVATPEGVEVLSKCSTCGSGSCSLSDKEKYISSVDESCEIYEEK